MSVDQGLDLRTYAALEVLEGLVQEVAHREIMPLFGVSRSRLKEDGSLVTAADTAVQAWLAEELRIRWPQFALVGEEMPEAEQRAALQSAHGAWCLDPLDGTTNFVNRLPFFAVSLALLQDGAPTLGMVYDPVRKECFKALRGQGAWLNGERLHALDWSPALRRCVALVDFKRLKPRLAGRLGIDPPYGSQRNWGSCALEWCWLAAGRAHLSVHGGQKLWDYAAGSLILQEAGGIATTLEGRPLPYDGLAPSSTLVARSLDLYEAWRTWINHNAGRR
ncbi:inositol monophosphatase family protein [Acidiferrobacter thiooxydans]|nr:inositol monophosphatase family protein [Acidiferrobacter thiooxydans]MDA8192235.1 inositol monophosphatase family protein [Gammaproteobacteria bacterium]UEO00281.1 inositol monophosphatase family protein [Acidiferrobacter thiooxydans]